MEILSRQSWGARVPRQLERLKIPTPNIFVHHTGTVFSLIAVAAEQTEMRKIQSFHMDTRGWDDIGYSFVVFPSGRVFEGRGWGVVGAHTERHNTVSHGVCFAGNFEQQQPTRDALEAARSLIRDGVARGFVASGFMLGEHRQVSQTVCPGRSLSAVLPSLLNYPRVEESVVPTFPEVPVDSPVVAAFPIVTNWTTTGYVVVLQNGAVYSFGADLYRGRVVYTP